MQKPTTHFMNQPFSYTVHGEVATTYGDMVLAAFMIAALFIIALVWVKNVNRAT